MWPKDIRHLIGASTNPVHTYRSCGCMRLVYWADFHAVLYYSNHTVWTLVWLYQFLCCVGLGSRHIDKHILVVLNVAEYVHQHRGQMYSRTKQQQGHVTGHLHSDSCLLVGRSSSRRAIPQQASLPDCWSVFDKDFSALWLV